MSKELVQSTLQRFPTWGDFINLCSPGNLCRQYSKVASIYHSIDRYRIKLEDISAAYPQTDSVPAGMLYVKKWLEYLNEFSNINKPLPHTQLDNVSIMIYTKYFHLFLSDLKLILEWILEGRYGKFYGSVDSQLILTAFYEYDIERKKNLQELNSKKEEKIELKDISQLSPEEINNLSIEMRRKFSLPFKICRNCEDAIFKKELPDSKMYCTKIKSIVNKNQYCEIK